MRIEVIVNILTKWSDPTKWSNTFDQLVELAIKGLMQGFISVFSRPCQVENKNKKPFCENKKPPS